GRGIDSIRRLTSVAVTRPRWDDFSHSATGIFRRQGESDKPGFKPAPQAVAITSLALPDRQNPPPESAEFAVHASVSRNVLSELARPERHVALRHVSEPAARMTVPEAAVHKHGNPMSGKHDVRAPR